MSYKIKVSVILPVYNVESYLEQCLLSIETQSLEDIELICIDDGSTDNSLEILKAHKEKDSRIIIISQENRGAAAARNRGMQSAKGEYLLFLDADDFFERNMLNIAYKSAIEQNADITMFRGDKFDTINQRYMPMNYSIKNEQLPPNNPFHYKDIPDNIFTFAVGWAWDKLYNREFVQNEGLQFQELRTSNDLYFVFSSLVKAKKIYILDDILVHHRVNIKESLSVTREQSWNCFYKALIALKKELENMGIYRYVERGFLNWVVHFSFWNLDTIEGKAYKNVYELLREKCFYELGMDKKAEGFYTSRRYYERIHEVLDTEFDEYVIRHMIQNKKRLEVVSRELNETKAELTSVKNSTTFKVGKAIMCLPIKMKKLVKGNK